MNNKGVCSCRRFLFTKVSAALPFTLPLCEPKLMELQTRSQCIDDCDVHCKHNPEAKMRKRPKQPPLGTVGFRRESPRRRKTPLALYRHGCRTCRKPQLLSRANEIAFRTATPDLRPECAFGSNGGVQSSALSASSFDQFFDILEERPVRNENWYRNHNR
jgi:hypothetical protein